LGNKTPEERRTGINVELLPWSAFGAVRNFPNRPHVAAQCVLNPDSRNLFREGSAIGIIRCKLCLEGFCEHVPSRSAAGIATCALRPGPEVLDPAFSHCFSTVLRGSITRGTLPDVG